MKASYFFSGAALALLGPALAWGQAPPPPPPSMVAGSPTGAAVPFTLQGQLRSPATGLVYLQHAGAGGHLDSARVQQGRFTLRSQAPAGTLGLLYTQKQAPFRRNYKHGDVMPNPKVVYLEAGTITISSPDSLAHATALGTPLNADYTSLELMQKPFSARFKQLNEQYEAATPEKRKDPAFLASINKQQEAITADRQLAMAAFIKRMPQSIVSLTVLEDYAGYSINVPEVEPLFNGLAPAVRSSPIGQDFAGRLAKAKLTAVGALAPEFTQNDVNGKPVSLKDFRGNYVLVDFWASWCGPCRQENPNVVANFNQYKNRNFTVLGVSLDRATGRDAWLKAIETDHLTWTHVSDLKYWQNDVARLYGINAVPQNFLVGPDGRIVARNVRGEELGKKLAAVLPAAQP